MKYIHNLDIIENFKMKDILTENVIGIISALVLFILTQSIIYQIEKSKKRKDLKVKEIKELKDSYDELVIKIAIALEYYAHYISSPLYWGKDTPDRIYNNYDSASKEIRHLATELSAFRLKVKNDDLRKSIDMPPFIDVNHAKSYLIGISNNMILSPGIQEFERNDEAQMNIKTILKIDKVNIL